MTTSNEPVSAEPSKPEAKDPTSAAEPSEVPATAWLDQLRQNITPLGLLLGVMIVLGVYLRVLNFGYPTSLQFDEHHFVETARGYLKHQSDWNDHPPLGKLLILVGMKLFGDNSVGFRIPSLIFGFLTVALGAFAAQRLFRAKWASMLAAALLSADGFLIAYSRAGLLDGFLTTASVAALLMITFDVSIAWGCVVGAILGFAASIKFSGIGVLLPLLLCIAVSKREVRTKLLALSAMVFVAGFVYVSTYGIGLSMTNKPSGLFDVLADTQRLLKHHSDLTDMKNPATSGWVTWILPKRPLLLGIQEKHGAIRALTTLGNLATWWGSVALALVSATVVLRFGWVRVLLGQQEGGMGKSTEEADTQGSGVPFTAFVLANGRATIALLLGSIGFLAPWILTHRDSYIYHFLPAYAPLVLLLSGFLAWYQERHSMRVFGFTVVALLVAAFYAPLWGYVPMTRDAFHLRLFIDSWR